MAYKLFNSKGDIIGTIAHIKVQLSEPTTITLDTGRTLQFNQDDIYCDSNHDAHIRKSGSFHRIANDSYCYANQAKETLDATYGKGSAYTIKKVIFNPPATVVYWSDCTKTVVKCSEKDVFDPEKGLAMAIAKRCAGNTGAYYAEIRHWVAECGKDYMESSSVKNDTLKYIFVGRLGQFCPIVKGADGAYHADIRHRATEFGRPYTESSSNEKDTLKKHIAQAKKSYETALEAATKGNPVNFLSEMGRVSAALSMLELEISK